MVPFIPLRGQARALFFAWISGYSRSQIIYVYGSEYAVKNRNNFLHSYGFDIFKPYSPSYFMSCLVNSPKDRY